MAQVNAPKSRVFDNLTPLLTNHAPFKNDWEEASFYTEAAAVTPVLVVGAGGLGCEIVKNLALSGVKNIHLVDMDTVDFTNLNRQFMFRKSDVGKSKADAIASFVSRRCPGVKITTHKKRVQELPFELYSQFPVIVGGLDNVEARKYLNHIAHLLNECSEETVCQYIDGATEGFEGQALLVDPYKTSCYECSLLGGLAQKPKVNYCTIANTPRTPEHCIQYALEVLWDDQRKGETRDNDNLEHMKWIFEKASQRAAKFNIEGVTEMLTLGVTKNIIPAIASTNALIAAVLTNEVLKLLSGCNPTLNNYLLYKGGTSVGSETYAAGKLPTCRACHLRQNRLQKLQMQFSLSDNLQKTIEAVKAKHEYINRPFVIHEGHIVLNPGDTERYQSRLQASFEQLIKEGKLSNKEKITIFLSDKVLRDQLKIDILFANFIPLNMLEENIKKDQQITGEEVKTEK